MSDKMMKICGKNPDGNASALRMDEDGNVKIKRYWESSAQQIIEFKITNETKKDSNGNYFIECGAFDISDWGMVSLRVRNTLSVAVTIYVYSDIKNYTYKIFKAFDGTSVSFVAPATSEIIITPDDLPILNYLQSLSFRVQAPIATPIDAEKSAVLFAYLKR